MNLEAWRKAKGLSQAALAELMNAVWANNNPDDQNHYAVDKIARMEKNTDSIAYVDLPIIMQALGISADQLLSANYVPPHMPKVKDNWHRINSIRNNLFNSLEECPDIIKEEVKTLIKEGTRKLCIAFLGRPDAGKSTLLNLLLEQKEGWLPTGWSPETSAVCYIKHIMDRPKWINDATVIVFKDSSEGAFNIKVLDEDDNGECRCKEDILVSGGYDLLSEYASHSGSHSGDEIGAIIIYVDAPVLLNCDFVDLPGFNPAGISYKNENPTCEDVYDSRDSMLGIATGQSADAMVYMSIANSFCYGDDAQMAQTMVTSLPPLENIDGSSGGVKPFGNIFIVASQAMAVERGSEDKLCNLLDKAAERIWDRIKGNPAIDMFENKSGYAYSEKELRDRFYTSESTSDKLTKRFLNDFVEFTENLPLIQIQRLKKRLLGFRNGKLSEIDNNLMEAESLRDNREKVISSYEEDVLHAMDYHAEIDREAKKMFREIDVYAKESAESVDKIYTDVINATYIRNVIEKKGYKKNKRDMEELSNDLNAELNNRISKLLALKSKQFSSSVDSFLSTLNTLQGTSNGYIPIKFNLGRAFAGGLVGLATFGALSAWAASCGNLGGYILVAKGVSILASMGIHVGGTAAAIKAISLIGGPTTIAIGIAVTAGLGVIATLGGTWKKTIGSKVVKAYEKAGACEEIKKSVAQYWSDTYKAFSKGVENIHKEWDNSLKSRKEEIDKWDMNMLNEKIDLLTKSRDYLNNSLEKSLEL